MTKTVQVNHEFFDDCLAGKNFVFVEGGFYQCGDHLVLQEYLPNIGSVTGRVKYAVVTYVLSDYYTLTQGYIVLGIRKPNIIEKVRYF